MAENRRTFTIVVLAAVLAVVLIMGIQIVLQIAGRPPHSTGDTIYFGGHNWRVIGVDTANRRTLLLSENVLEQATFHTTGAYLISWEESAMRYYLNNEFFYNTFTEEERNQIAHVMLSNNANPWFYTPGGNSTYDRIFLLSIDEVAQYMGDSRRLANRDSDIDGVSGTRIFSDRHNHERIATSETGHAAGWMLRSPGRASGRGYVATVNASGHIVLDGIFVAGTGGGVRPAFWLYY